MAKYHTSGIYQEGITNFGIISNTLCRIPTNILIIRRLIMSYQNADFIIHIDEVLSTNQIHAIENVIGRDFGVHSVCVNDQHRHLMLVDYDPQEISSKTILNNVVRQGVHAELVGL